MNNLTWHNLFLYGNSNAELIESKHKVLDKLKKDEYLAGESFRNYLYDNIQNDMYRYSAVYSTKEELKNILSQFEGDSVSCMNTDKKEPSLFFMFSGQGGQYLGMGKDLYNNNVFFKNTMEQCFSILESKYAYNFRQFILSEDHENKELLNLINQTEITQPLLFILEYSLAKMLINWNIKPNAMIGYSFGEYVAATLAGVFSIEDALLLVALRGKLMQSLPSGAMLNVPIPEEQLIPLLEPGISIAIVNNPSCIVSGNDNSISKFELKMKKMRILTMRIQSNFAAHSFEMDRILEPFENLMNKISVKLPKSPIISSITGDWVEPEIFIQPNYWTKHMHSTIRFSNGIQRLQKTNNSLFLEIGPGRELRVLTHRYIENASNRCVNTVRHKEKNISDICHIKKTIGWLWQKGVNVDWEKVKKS